MKVMVKELSHVIILRSLMEDIFKNVPKDDKQTIVDFERVEFIGRSPTQE